MVHWSAYRGNYAICRKIHLTDFPWDQNQMTYLIGVERSLGLRDLLGKVGCLLCVWSCHQTIRSNALSFAGKPKSIIQTSTILVTVVLVRLFFIISLWKIRFTFLLLIRFRILEPCFNAAKVTENTVFASCRSESTWSTKHSRCRLIQNKSHQIQCNRKRMDHKIRIENLIKVFVVFVLFCK